MSTLRVTTVTNPSGGQPTIDGLAKAWVNFNGSGTVAIRASFNVSSITDNGTGQYTINFTNALADTNFVISGSGGNLAATTSGRSIIRDGAWSTTACQIRDVLSSTNATVDDEYIGVAVFR